MPEHLADVEGRLGLGRARGAGRDGHALGDVVQRHAAPEQGGEARERLDREDATAFAHAARAEQRHGARMRADVEERAARTQQRGQHAAGAGLQDAALRHRGQEPQILRRQQENAVRRPGHHVVAERDRRAGRQAGLHGAGHGGDASPHGFQRAGARRPACGALRPGGGRRAAVRLLPRAGRPPRRRRPWRRPGGARSSATSRLRSAASVSSRSDSLARACSMPAVRAARSESSTAVRMPHLQAVEERRRRRPGRVQAAARGGAEQRPDAARRRVLRRLAPRRRAAARGPRRAGGLDSAATIAAAHGVAAGQRRVRARSRRKGGVRRHGSSPGAAARGAAGKRGVPAGGFEPPRPCGLRILSPLRLPFRQAGEAGRARRQAAATCPSARCAGSGPAPRRSGYRSPPACGRRCAR